MRLLKRFDPCKMRELILFFVFQCYFAWHAMEGKKIDEASNYKEFHLLHDTGAMYTKVIKVSHIISNGRCS